MVSHGYIIRRDKLFLCCFCKNDSELFHQFIYMYEIYIDHLSIFTAITQTLIFRLTAFIIPFLSLSVSDGSRIWGTGFCGPNGQSCQQTNIRGKNWWIWSFLTAHAYFLLLLFLLWPHGVTAENWRFNNAKYILIQSQHGAMQCR